MLRRKVQPPNISVDRPILIGSIATPLNKRDAIEGVNTHKWTVYVKGLHGEDISYFIKKVVFKLHDSFATPTRVIEKPPFEVTESGWGEFDILIKIHFVDIAGEKPVQLYHHLQLFPKDEASIKKTLNSSVVSEIYEEVVFNEPTEELYQVMLENPAPNLSIISEHHKFNTQTEKEELEKLAAAQSKITSMIETCRGQLRSLEEEFQKLQSFQ
ncbi:NuA4 histone H4 acetyltransferase complex and the SWR1 complex subunit [Nowakowskiella sp. JEL0407]|nr:NuA4 histone H4 acetyltransferase complex and the SWR1 complex subunit [Nowakowskiella sp. JEL0407]